MDVVTEGTGAGVSLSARRASRRGVGGLSSVELPDEERASCLIGTTWTDALNQCFSSDEFSG